MAEADQGFVAASPARVFEVLSDAAAYPAWWPGARAGREGELRLPGLPLAMARVDRVRPAVGLFVRLAGRSVEGQLEWYLEPFKEGTVVNCITNLEGRRRWSRRRVLAIRSGIRAGMVALKGMLE